MGDKREAERYGAVGLLQAFVRLVDCVVQRCNLELQGVSAWPDKQTRNRFWGGMHDHPVSPATEQIAVTQTSARPV